MEPDSFFHQKFHSLKCCVLIPTFNNEATLKNVLFNIESFTTNIIVVNDGSTDATAEILSHFEHLEIITFSRNCGKGDALKRGFKRAGEMGYEYAITIDSDGQHFPDDLPVFLEALEKKNPHDPETLVIGSRKMNAPGIPEKSSLGNKLSSFWFWVETGVKLQDTQCGYRLYPVNAVNSLHLYTSRFELEIEILVKASWAGVKLKNLPVKVYYEPRERVTHFRPFQDVTRIVILNIWFLAAALFYIAPRNLLRKFRKKEKKEVTEKGHSRTEILESEV